jgi:hypothetical protein
MNVPTYQQAVTRIRAEYNEMPGMRLTPEQVQRLSGIELAVCRLVLDELVGAGFLQEAPDHTYSRGRASDPLRIARYPRNRPRNSTDGLVSVTTRLVAPGPLPLFERVHAELARAEALCDTAHDRIAWIRHGRLSVSDHTGQPERSA